MSLRYSAATGLTFVTWVEVELHVPVLETSTHTGEVKMPCFSAAVGPVPCTKEYVMARRNSSEKKKMSCSVGCCNVSEYRQGRQGYIQNCCNGAQAWAWRSCC